MAWDLTKAVNEILGEYVDEVENALFLIENEVARDTVKRLNETSPYNEHSNGKNGKHYQKDWYVDKKTVKHYAHIIIANRQYQLTHLLEFGHNIVRNGVVVGHANDKAHIKDAEKWAQKQVVDRSELWLNTHKQKPKITIEVKDKGGSGS